ncbi:hypothetical protein Pint_05022 [Pistacia integerrima]|uniref:Uncharacterized protein n=1 Tax=Pistacia integerrima TaxID=434235 RepID=A0ACC0Z0N7_9ROSI|nr:hypothetical protein Pint_05022 [Pistacia integerrima]
MSLSKWKMNGNSCYALIGGWNEVKKRNKLEKNQMIQVWSFRVDEMLCFAFVRVAITSPRIGFIEAKCHSLETL